MEKNTFSVIKTAHAFVVSGILAWVGLILWQARIVIDPRYVRGVFWEYGSISLYAHEVVLLIVLAVWLIVLVVSGDLWLVVKKISVSITGVQHFLALAICLLILWLVGGVFWSVDPLVTVSRLVHIVLSALGVGVLVYYKVSWQSVAVMLVAGEVAQGLLAINQTIDQVVIGSTYFGISPQIPWQYGTSVILYDQGRWLRAYGSLPHPNILGGISAIVTLLAVALYCSWCNLPLRVRTMRAQVVRAGMLGALVFIMSALVVSFSRAGWLGAVVGLLWFGVAIVLFKANARGALLRAALIVIMTLGIWVYAQPSPFVVRLSAQAPLEQQSIDERGISFEDSKEIVKSSWLYGTGFGTYTHQLLTQYPERAMHINQPVHNTLLLIASELGAVGFLLVGSVVFLVWRRSKSHMFSTAVIFSMGAMMMFDHWWVSLVVGGSVAMIMLYIVHTIDV